MSKPTIAELMALRVGDGILINDGRIREVQGIDLEDAMHPVETYDDWIAYDQIDQIIYKAPRPGPMTPAEVASAPRKPVALVTCTGISDEDDLIFALANDGTIFMGPARASGGQFSWIQVPSLPQS